VKLHFNDTDPALFGELYDLIRSVPPGKVITYGGAAECVTDMKLTARRVGAAMRVAPDDIPWQRVVGAGGYLRIASVSPEAAVRQRALLEREGVTFTDSGRVVMSRHSWNPYADDANA
jgi:methylated-DNA-protein-cysteine methyltransferase-like protein